MKRFNSRYERIRHLREQQEDVCRAAAAARNAERSVEEQHRNSVENWLDVVQREAANDMAAGLSGALLISMTSLFERGRLELKSADESLQRAEERLRVALEQHTQSRAELNLVEKIIHREHTEHRREQLRHEEHQLLEQAVQAYHRNQQICGSHGS
jgi:hypothetical protein